MMSLDNRKYYQDFFVLSRIRELKFRKFFPTRPEGAEALSPGQRPGYSNSQQCAL